MRPAVLLGTPGRFALAGLLTLLLLAALTLFSGCKSTATPAPPQQAAVTPAPAQPAPQGQLQSDGTYAATPSAQPAPYTTPAGPPPPPAYRTIPAGTPVAVTITQTLSASRNEVGDGFSGVLAAPVTFRGGSAFARGTHVQGTVVASKGRGRFAGSGALGIELTSIGGDRVSTSEYEREAKGRGKRTAGFIGGGAGLGAIIGGIAGGGKGAAIGALAGGGGGTAAAAYTGDRDVVIPSESTVTFRLRAPIEVR
jgi:hypothetical protein